MPRIVDSREFAYLYNEVAGLVCNVRYIQTLCSDEKTTSILNAVASNFFADVQCLLMDACVVSVYKLALDKRKDVLTLRTLVDMVVDDTSLHFRLNDSLSHIESLTEQPNLEQFESIGIDASQWSYKLIRHKRVAHADEVAAVDFSKDVPHVSWYDPSANSLFSVVGSIVDFINEIERNDKGGWTDFYRIEESGGASSLLRVICSAASLDSE